MQFTIVSLTLLATFAVAAPILQPRAAVIPDKYVVVMKKGASDNALQQLLTTLKGSGMSTASIPETVEIGSFKALQGTFGSSLITTISQMLDVAYIEPVQKVYASALVTQSGAPWGLGRISHKEKGSTTYVYDSTAGSGTFAYVIDTGIYTAHNQFGGRASWGANFADDDDTDGNGHGTHCAGTIGSKTYGVSKNTRLIAVKVLGADGSGTNSGVISGIQWAVRDAKSKGRIGKAVGSMSLGGEFSQATNDAVAAAVDAGLFMAVAAGNDNLNAATFSPASEPKACTVGASDKNDARSSFSNYGSLVDIFAPGTAILSTWIGGADQTNTISGTSMATPHVAGLAVYLIGLPSENTPAASSLCQRIKSLSNSNKLTLGVSNTVNQLAYNGNGA